MSRRARILGSSQILAHVPDLVLSGSKVRREVARDPRLLPRIASSLRSAEDAAAYLPNQVFLGAHPPLPLKDDDRPWWSRPLSPVFEGPFGLLFSQEEFLSVLEAVDRIGLVEIEPDHTRYEPGSMKAKLIGHLVSAKSKGPMDRETVEIPGAEEPLGRVSWGYPEDEALAPVVILENLAAKASAALALLHVLDRHGEEPTSLDYVISCSEEAVGDRYQRGGGNMGKAVAEAVGAGRASGFDVKNFCAGPIPALLVASTLVETGAARRVAVVAGGSLPKLGMKFQGHLEHEMPVLEDCLGAVAVLVGEATGGPFIRHDLVGRHSVRAGSSNQQIFEELVFRPLQAGGLEVSDVDLLGTELHNPELTEPQRSGNIPLRNFGTIAALASQRGQLGTGEVEAFLNERCAAGFAPTQGHIASAVCLLPHALRAMEEGGARRAQLAAKASLFLGQMSSLSDGMSLVVESGVDSGEAGDG